MKRIGIVLVVVIALAAGIMAGRWSVRTVIASGDEGGVRWERTKDSVKLTPVESNTAWAYVVMPIVGEKASFGGAQLFSGEASVEFIGLFARTGQFARVLKARETYNAVFKIRVPVNADYEKIGFHVRTGIQRIVEKDRIVVKRIHIPSADTIIKSGSFTPPLGEGEDMQKITNSDA